MSSRVSLPNLFFLFKGFFFFLKLFIVKLILDSIFEAYYFPPKKILELLLKLWLHLDEFVEHYHFCSVKYSNTKIWYEKFRFFQISFNNVLQVSPQKIFFLFLFKYHFKIPSLLFLLTMNRNTFNFCMLSVPLAALPNSLII